MRERHLNRGNPIRPGIRILALLALLAMGAGSPVLGQAGRAAAGQAKKAAAPMPSALPALASTASLGAQAPQPIGLPLSADLLNQETEVPLHLLIGHSMFLKTTDRLHRVYVGSPTVLQSFIPSPKEVVITAVKPGTSSVALWNANGQSVLYAVSADLDVTKLRRSIEEALPGQDVHVDSQEGRVYLSGTVIGDPAYQEAIKLASSYSKDVVSSLAVTYVHPQQVRLQVRIAEVDRTKLDQFGFNFFSGGRNTSSTGTQQFTSVGATQTSTTTGSGGSPVQVGLAVSNPLNFLLYNSKLNIGAAMADLEAKNILQILAEPTITTLSGHE